MALPTPLGHPASCFLLAAPDGTGPWSFQASPFLTAHPPWAAGWALGATVAHRTAGREQTTQAQDRSGWTLC